MKNAILIEKIFNKKYLYILITFLFIFFNSFLLSSSYNDHSGFIQIKDRGNKKSNIAVLSSHGTSSNLQLTDLLLSINPYYNIASFDLKALPQSPKKTLNNINHFNLIIVSNPKKKFSNKEKYILDQFIQAGGNTLFLINSNLILNNTSNGNINSVVKNDLELDELFFKYGIKLSNQRFLLFWNSAN